jgi:CheY-like chemotaxis protein
MSGVKYFQLRCKKMPEARIRDFSAMIATTDKRTATKTKNLFARVCEISTTRHLKRILEEEDVERKRQYDVILLDVQMPGVSGEGALMKLREMASPIPIVVLTANGEEALSALQAGARDYLMKPIRTEDLITAVRIAVEQHSRDRQIVDMTKIDAPLPHLVEKFHDPRNGHLSATAISDFFGLSVAEFARVIGRGISTVHKTPIARSLQEALRPFEAMASGLLRLTGSEQRARMWLHAQNPALEGHAPIEWLRLGKVGDLASFIQDMLEGRPA